MTGIFPLIGFSDTGCAQMAFPYATQGVLGAVEGLLVARPPEPGGSSSRLAADRDKLI